MFMSRAKKLYKVYKEITPIITGCWCLWGLGLGTGMSYIDWTYKYNNNNNLLQNVVHSTTIILRAGTVFAVVGGVFWPVTMPFFCYKLFKGDVEYMFKSVDYAVGKSE